MIIMFDLYKSLSLLCCLCFAPTLSVPNRISTPVPDENWTGRWFPEHAAEVFDYKNEVDHDRKGMGVIDSCDDGKTNLTIDDDGDHSAYLCMHPRNRFASNPALFPVLEFENIPAAYVAEHRCMNESILYSTTVPTFGTHRKLWPIYGEYLYVPVQRWLHTLEHGGIVALYHPCANLQGIARLKKTVKNCLRRHVITPWPLLDQSRPFALVAWGVRQRMSNVTPNNIRNFIQNYALHGPEKLSKEGQFDKYLLSRAEIVTDYEDSILCPQPLAHD